MDPNDSLNDLETYLELPSSEEGGKNVYFQLCSRPIVDDPHAAVKELLRSWNLEHLNELFKSQRITIDVLKIIKEKHFPRLFENSCVGDLALFEHKLGEWKTSLGIGYEEIDIISLKGNSEVVSFSQAISSSPSPTIKEDLPLPCISLCSILNSFKGKQISKYYEENSRIQDIHRQALITLICNYYIENSLHMNLNTSYSLEEAILQRFKGEKIEFYRTEKRGKLYTKFCNLKSSTKLGVKRSILPDDDVIKAGKTKKKDVREFAPESDADECLRSLQYDNLSVAEFDSCWQACVQYRLNHITKETTLDNILTEWPDYKKPGGYRLIDKDFGVLFPNCSGVLIKWAEQAGKLHKFLLDENHLRDKNLTNILEKINSTDIKTDTAAVKLFWCLHGYLVPTQKASRKDNSGRSSTIRFTIKSSQEAFMFVGSSVQELDDHLSFLKRKSENIQPFILAIGDKNFEKLSSFYVYLDGIKFMFSNFLRALDICFKIFNLFNLEYPLACSQIWTFIEHHFYEMDFSKNKSPKMFLLTEALKTCCGETQSDVQREAGL